MLRLFIKSMLISSVLHWSCVTAQKLENPQDKTLDPRPLLSIKAEDMAIDRLGNMYFVTHSNEVQRYSNTLTKMYHYTNDRMGELSLLDVSNPHKILAYFKDYETIVLLDNTLTEIFRIDLNQMGYWNIELVCLSKFNDIWLYDPTDFKLKRIGNDGQLIAESYHILTEVPDWIPIAMHSTESYVSIYDPRHGFLIFDDLGIFMKKIVANDLEWFDYFDQKILAKKNSGYLIINMHTGEIQSLDISFKISQDKIIDVEFHNGNWWLLTADGLYQVEISE